jgi:hypothetical protein
VRERAGRGFFVKPPPELVAFMTIGQKHRAETSRGVLVPSQELPSYPGSFDPSRLSGDASLALGTALAFLTHSARSRGTGFGEASCARGAF